MWRIHEVVDYVNYMFGVSHVWLYDCMWSLNSICSMESAFAGQQSSVQHFGHVQVLCEAITFFVLCSFA